MKNVITLIRTNTRHAMRGTRFKQEQLIAILREAQAGVKLSEQSREYGISEGTIYN